jgi:hypothetical protein
MRCRIEELELARAMAIRIVRASRQYDADGLKAYIETEVCIALAKHRCRYSHRHRHGADPAFV